MRFLSSTTTTIGKGKSKNSVCMKVEVTCDLKDGAYVLLISGMVRKTWVFLMTVSLIRRYFCAAYYYAGKARFIKRYENMNRKLVVTRVFSKLQFCEKSHALFPF